LEDSLTIIETLAPTPIGLGMSREAIARVDEDGMRQLLWHVMQEVVHIVREAKRE